jgi:hypothetical protein
MKVVLCTALAAMAALGAYWLFGGANWKSASPSDPALTPVGAGSSAGSSAGSVDVTPLKPEKNVSAERVLDQPTKPPRDFRRTAIELWALDAAGLREVYSRGTPSSSEADKFLAYTAGSFCVSVLRNLQPQIDPNLTGAQWKEYEKSSRELKARCADFYQVHPSDFMSSINSLKASFLDPDSYFCPGKYEMRRDTTARDQIDDIRTNLRNALMKDGEASMLWVSGGLSTWLEFAALDERYKSTVDPMLRDPSTLSTAVLLAQCQLGFACNSSSMVYLVSCASGVGCAGSFSDDLLASVDEAQRATAESQAATIVSAIRNRRLSALGL